MHLFKAYNLMRFDNIYTCVISTMIKILNISIIPNLIPLTSQSLPYPQPRQLLIYSRQWFSKCALGDREVKTIFTIKLRFFSHLSFSFFR